MIESDQLINVTPPTVLRFCVASVLSAVLLVAEIGLFLHIGLHPFNWDSSASLVYFVFQYLVHPLHGLGVLLLIRRKLGHNLTEILFPVLTMIAFTLVMFESCARQAELVPGRSVLFSLFVAGAQLAIGYFFVRRYGPAANPLPRYPSTPEIWIVGATAGLAASLFIPTNLLACW